jgi:hypothetical protein
MKVVCVISSMVLAAALASGQTTTQTQIPHIKTALNHITILEYGEPVTTLALADSDSFQVEKHDDKVLVKPLHAGASTNLFVWTATRQFNYELDPAGSPAAMDVLVKTDLLPDSHKTKGDSVELSKDEISRMAEALRTKTLADAHDVERDPAKSQENSVVVRVEQVYRLRDRLYVRYTVINHSDAPFRVTTPDVYWLIPTQTGVSLITLRDHQLSPQTLGTLKTKQGGSLQVTAADTSASDLASGKSATGVLSFIFPAGDTPRLLEFNFGMDQHHPLIAVVVL